MLSPEHRSQFPPAIEDPFPRKSREPAANAPTPWRNESCGQWVLTLLVALILGAASAESLAARRHHHASQHHVSRHGRSTQPIAAASPVSRDEIPQAEGEDFEGSVREMQSWLRQREAERHENWGRDLVTPEIDKPANRHYFEDQGLDAEGYRQIGDLRFHLRNLEEDTGERYGSGRTHRRHFSHHQTTASRLRRSGSHRETAGATQRSHEPSHSVHSSGNSRRSKHR